MERIYVGLPWSVRGLKGFGGGDERDLGVRSVEMADIVSSPLSPQNQALELDRLRYISQLCYCELNWQSDWLIDRQIYFLLP